jgi:hypothetical protein
MSQKVLLVSLIDKNLFRIINFCKITPYLNFIRTFKHGSFKILTSIGEIFLRISFDNECSF